MNRPVRLLWLMMLVAGASRAEDTDDDAKPSMQQDNSGSFALTQSQQQAVGIRIDHPMQMSSPPQIEAYGLVLDPVALVADAGRMDSTQAAADAAAADVARLDSLYRNNADASLKALQASRSLAIEAAAQARTAAATFRLQWGPVAALSNSSRRDLIDALSAGRHLLVRADVPGHQLLSAIAPRALVVVDGVSVAARVLGALPRTDPQSQSTGWLLQIDHRPEGLGPGARAHVRLQTAPVGGVLVPATALLYGEQGRLCLPRNHSERRRQVSIRASGGQAAGACGRWLAGRRSRSHRQHRRAGRRRPVVAARHQYFLGRGRGTRLAPMLATIVRGSLSFPRIVTALSLLIAIMGGYALLNARLDVFPDFAPPHVLVQAEAPGLDATQVESLVTRPLEGLLAGAENVAAVRSTSSQGLSAIQVVFGREGDPYRQRQVITERLADASSLLPTGVGPPLLSPLSSSMEYLLHFGFTSERLSPIELRDLIRWTIKPQILAVPGVAQAQIFGGDSRERQLLIDPLKLQAAGVTLDDVDDAVRRATQLIGGGYLETATQRIVLQAQPPGASLESLAQAAVATQNGAPLRIGDIASVRDDAAPRFGDAIIGGRPGILVETFDSIWRQHARCHARSGAAPGNPGTRTGVARCAVSPRTAQAGEFHRERDREAAQFAADRRGAGGRAAAADVSGLARRVRVVQFNSGVAACDHLDTHQPRHLAQYDEPRRPGGRFRRRGR